MLIIIKFIIFRLIDNKQQSIVSSNDENYVRQVDL